jgi:hypothetical protein
MASQGAKLLPMISTRHRWIKNEATATSSLGPIVVGVAQSIYQESFKSTYSSKKYG